MATDQSNTQQYESDENILCDDCDKMYDGDCPVHGPLEWIKSSLPVKSSDYTSSFTSLPEGLVFKESGIPGIDTGVFAARLIYKRTMFGPFEGKQVEKDCLQENNLTFSWDLLHEGIASNILDGSDEKQSNWMRFVTYARDRREQNLIAFQYRGQIFYRTFRDVYPGEELMVWYEEEYMCSLDELHTENSNVQIPEFACQRCRLVFAGATYLSKHKKFRCPDGPLLGTYGARTTGLVGALFRLPVAIANEPWSAPLNNNNNVLSKEKPRLETESHHGRRKNKPRKLPRPPEVEEIWNPEQPFGPPLISELSEIEPISAKEPTTVLLPPETQTLNANTVDDVIIEIENNNTNYLKRLTSDEISSPQLEKKPKLDNGVIVEVDEHEKYPYECGTCGKTFARPTWWAKHESGCVKNKEKENQLNKQSSSPKYETPAKKPRKEPYACAYCGKCFACPSWKIRHEKTHTKHLKSTNRKPADQPTVLSDAEKSLPHKCKDCGRGFEYPSRLERHRSIKHPTPKEMENRKHVCRDCGRGFAVASWLTRHRMKAHSNSFATKKHICGVCGRSFALASWLSRHQKVHENTTTSVEPEEPVSQEATTPTATEPKKKYLLPWVCGDCGVRFKYVSWLKRHQKNSRHNNGHFDREDQTSLYKWSCDHPGCDKSYKMKHHLARHKLSHLRDPKEAPMKPVNKETNFVCDVCGKEFITRRMFTRHERKHAKGVGTSVKAECGICSKTFDTKDLLERHFKRIHGNEVSAESNSHAVGPPYSCRYCSKKFKEPLAFGRHIAHHKKLERTQEAKAQLQKKRDGESEINKNKNDKNDLITSKHKTSEEDSSKSKSFKESTASKLTKARRETPERDAKRDKFKNRSSDRKADTLDSSNSDTNPFECDICGRRFAVSFWLTRHKAEHDQAERPHQCDECGRTFAVAAWLTRHKRDHETVASSTASDENSKPDPIIKGNSKVYKCDICGLEFAWPSWMLKHRKLHTIKLTKVKKRGKTKFTSVTQSVPPVTKFEPSNPHEGKSAQEMFELVDKNGTREYQCKVCKKTTIWHTGIIYHVRVHHTHEKPFKCKFCPKAFHMAGDLTKHNRRHTEEELYNCNYCDKTFESSQQAKKHENSHNKSTPFQCKYCGKAYSNRSSVWRHISRSACPESLQATRSKDSATIAVKRAKKTLQSALSEPPTKQPKLSKSKIVLEKGENLDKQEEPDRPVKLVEDKGFKIKKVRGKGHEKKSSKKKSYVCQNCNKTFTSKEAFAGHIEKYIENNQIVCEFCGKCWVRSADLKRHRRVHTGERPYVCPDCGLGFKVSDALKRHMVKLHPKSTKSPIIVKTTDNSEAEFEQKASDNDVSTDMIDDDAQLDSKAKQEEDNMNKEKIKRKKNKKEQEKQDSQMESVEYIQKDLDLEKEDGNSTKENMNHENAQHGNSNPPNDENYGNKKQKKPMKASKKNKKKTNKNKCEYCGKLYSGPGNLTRHVRLHTGEKPFKCKECGQCFMRSDILTQHIGKHHYIK